jgi:hypothetical protein
MPPKAKAKGKAKAKAKALDRYAYLPTDLQRAAVYMDRADFLRKLQKGQHDREYRHVSVQHGAPPLSAHGGKDLQEKISALNAEIADLKRRPPQPFRKTYAPPAPSTASTAVPGSRVTFGGSSASGTPVILGPWDVDL